MAETITYTYTPHIKCEISPGIREDMVVAKVVDINNRPDYLEVSKSQITTENGQPYLAVGFVEVDRQTKKVLIEFPHEADSGRNRIWAPFSAFRQMKEKS